MNLVSCLQLLFLLEMFDAKRINHQSKTGISIPLRYHPLNTGKTGPRYARRYFNVSDKWGEGVHMANFSFYNPPGWHNMVFDTTTDKSWIYGLYDYCDDLILDVQKKHRAHNPFDSQRTYIADFYENRGGWVFGFEAENITVEFPEIYGVEPYYHFNMTFLEVTKASKSLIDQPFDAVVGMGPSAQIFQVCFNWGKPSSIALVLPPLQYAQSSAAIAELVLCGTQPTTRKLSESGVPLEIETSVSQSSWQVTFERILIDKFVPEPQKGPYEVGKFVPVAFDINSPYLYMPQAALDTFKSLVNVTEDPNTNELQISCDNDFSFPVIHFVTNNRTLYLSGSDYTLHKSVYRENMDYGRYIREKILHVVSQFPPTNGIRRIRIDRDRTQRSDFKIGTFALRKRNRNEKSSKPKAKPEP